MISCNLLHEILFTTDLLRNPGSSIIFNSCLFYSHSRRYHPGRVQMIQRSTDEPIYVVKFDDGECAGVRSDQMVLLPKPNIDSKLFS